ncbi:MAG: hypothetical protein AAB869_03715 [Patescibacteria group bacterium]
MQKLFAHGFALMLLFAGMTSLVHAAGSSYSNPITYGDITNLQSLLLALVDLVFLIGVPIIVVFIIYSGFLFVSAGDNETEVGKAKTVFMWTVIGALVFLGAKAISLAIQETITSLGAT